MYVDSLFGLRRALIESAQARLLCFVRTSVVWGKQTKTGQNGQKPHFHTPRRICSQTFRPRSLEVLRWQTDWTAWEGSGTHPDGYAVPFSVQKQPFLVRIRKWGAQIPQKHLSSSMAHAQNQSCLAQQG